MLRKYISFGIYFISKVFKVIIIYKIKKSNVNKILLVNVNVINFNNEFR